MCYLRRNHKLSLAICLMKYANNKTITSLYWFACRLWVATSEDCDFLRWCSIRPRTFCERHRWRFVWVRALTRKVTVPLPSPPRCQLRARELWQRIRKRLSRNSERKLRRGRWRLLLRAPTQAAGRGAVAALEGWGWHLRGDRREDCARHETHACAFSSTGFIFI